MTPQNEIKCIKPLATKKQDMHADLTRSDGHVVIQSPELGFLVIDRVSLEITTAPVSSPAAVPASHAAATYENIQAEALLGITRLGSEQQTHANPHTVLAESYLVLATGSVPCADVGRASVYCIISAVMLPLSSETMTTDWSRSKAAEHQIADVCKFIGISGMYYSLATADAADGFMFSVCNSAQRSNVKSAPTGDFVAFGSLGSHDTRFMWNAHMLTDFERCGAQHWVQPVTQGFFSTSSVISTPGVPLKVSLAVRRSSHRAGPRASAKGIDDAGHVAAFFETEIILERSDHSMCSYVLVRGSAPVFWDEQGGLLGAGSKPCTLRNDISGKAALAEAFEKHAKSLHAAYSSWLVLDLIDLKSDEATIGAKYQELCKAIETSAVPFKPSSYERVDMSASEKCGTFAKSLAAARAKIKSRSQQYGYFAVGDNVKRVQRQNGVLRVSDLDCISRTTLAHALIGHCAAASMIAGLGILQSTELAEVALTPTGSLKAVDGALRSLWACAANAISRQYQGNSSNVDIFTQLEEKSLGAGLMGLMGDMKKELNKAITAADDGGKQKAQNIFQGKEMHLSWAADITARAMRVRESAAMGLTPPIAVLCASWNVNGRIIGEGGSKDGIKDDVAQLLLPEHLAMSGQPSIIAIGIQEFVPLNASNIAAGSTGGSTALLAAMKGEEADKVGADVERIRRTEDNILHVLGRDKYYALERQQLVGLFLIVFAAKSIKERVARVQIDNIPCGVGGLANKGGIALSCVVDGTSLCFVTSHLAAGMKEIKNRNDDFKTISRDLRFKDVPCMWNFSSDGRSTPLAHDVCFWFGDLNYRVQTSSTITNAQIIQWCSDSNFHALNSCDQLNLVRAKGEAFNGFLEMPLNFVPTYKYDTGTNIWDTSEKQRPPAWCDRVLWRSDRVVPTPEHAPLYNRAELCMSDHKPVHAAFDVFTGSVSPQARAEFRQAIAADLAVGRFPSLPEKTNHPRVRPPLPVPPVLAAPPLPPAGAKPSKKPLPPVPSAPKPNVSMDDMLADTSSSSLPISSDWGAVSFSAPSSASSGWGDAAAPASTASSGWGDLLSSSSDAWSAPATAAAAKPPVPPRPASLGWGESSSTAAASSSGWDDLILAPPAVPVTGKPPLPARPESFNWAQTAPSTSATSSDLGWGAPSNSASGWHDAGSSSTSDLWAAAASSPPPVPPRPASGWSMPAPSSAAGGWDDLISTAPAPASAWGSSTAAAAADEWGGPERAKAPRNVPKDEGGFGW